MRKLSLGNLSLCESNMLSQEEKKKTLGGSNDTGCGIDLDGFVWRQCQSGMCVRDLSECPDGNSGGPCIDGPLLPSGNCTDPY